MRLRWDLDFRFLSWCRNILRIWVWKSLCFAWKKDKTLGRLGVELVVWTFASIPPNAYVEILQGNKSQEVGCLGVTGSQEWHPHLWVGCCYNGGFRVPFSLPPCEDTTRSWCLWIRKWVLARRWICYVIFVTASWVDQGHVFDMCRNMSCNSISGLKGKYKMASLSKPFFKELSIFVFPSAVFVHLVINRLVVELGVSWYERGHGEPQGCLFVSKIHFTYPKMHSLIYSSYNSVVFGISTRLCNHYPHQNSRMFSSLPKISSYLLVVTLSCLVAWTLGIHSSTSCLDDFAFLGYLAWIEQHNTYALMFGFFHLV